MGKSPKGFGDGPRVAQSRSLRERGIAAAGVYASSIGLEAPYQLGRVERHGTIWNTVAAQTNETLNITGVRAMSIVAAEVNHVVNEMNRLGGVSHTQWVLG